MWAFANKYVINNWTDVGIRVFAPVFLTFDITNPLFEVADLKAIKGQSVLFFFFSNSSTELIMQGIARTQSPSPRNYAPESPTFEAIAGVSPPECNGQASPWEYPLVDQGVSCAR